MHGRFLTRLLPAVFWASVSTLGSVTANAQHYLTDLGPGTAYGINNSGQVVLSNGIWSNGIVTVFPPGFTGVAINSSGQVAGTFVDTANGVAGSAAVYSNGTVTIVAGTNDDPAVGLSAALGINDSGAIVGQASADGGANLYAFVYSNGTTTVVPPFAGSVPGFGKAVGISDSGLVAGWMANSTSNPAAADAFIYNSNTAVLTDLGPGSAVFAINAGGQGTGASLATEGHAALFSGGAVIDLGVLPGGSSSSGSAINATGQVVGGSTIMESAATHAFFYSGTMIDMNALVSASDPLQPYVTLDAAQGINDSRLIVVNGVDIRTQLPHAYLLQGPWLDVAPGGLSFLNQAVGTNSSAQSVSLSNAGSTPLTVGAISTSGDFGETNNCGTSLAPGGQCAVMVTFGPTAAGNRMGVLTVVSDGAPYPIPLAGIAPIQVSISAGAAATTTGVPVNLAWSASTGASCTATGGTAADGWTGAKATSGSVSLTEPYAMLTPSMTLTFSIECTSSASGLSARKSTNSMEIAAAQMSPGPSSMSGGGGAVDAVAILFLGGVAALRRHRQGRVRDTMREGTASLAR